MSSPHLSHPSLPRSLRVWVLHAGALGDSVLIWPLLRAIIRQGHTLTLVSSRSKTRLAQAWLFQRPPHATPSTLTIRDLDAPEMSEWFQSSTRNTPSLAACAQTNRDFRTFGKADLLITFLADDSPHAQERWRERAHTLIGAERVSVCGQPGSASRAALWNEWQVDTFGSATPAPTLPDVQQGRVVLHVGAGGEHKRWPLARWLSLASSLQARAGLAPRLIAGEVERERLSSSERDLFASAQGEFIDDLDGLAVVLSRARLLIGCDSGPAHLAAQLGINTLALFGPTDPRVWAPVGPKGLVRLLAPPADQARPTNMHWLSVQSVAQAAAGMLG